MAEILENADESARRFFAELRSRRLMSTRCKACGAGGFPPRSFCHVCLSQEMEWIELPDTGSLLAFTTQERGARFIAPDVLGLVQLDEGPRLLSRIDAPLDSLSIGQRVRLDFVEVDADLVLHQFRPEPE
jgi:uncharacterized OB-fold protein